MKFGILYTPIWDRFLANSMSIQVTSQSTLSYYSNPDNNAFNIHNSPSPKHSASNISSQIYQTQKERKSTEFIL